MSNLMGPTPSLHDATETLPPHLHPSILPHLWCHPCPAATLWSPQCHLSTLSSSMPLLPTRPELQGEIFAAPQQALGFPFLTASHISSCGPQMPPSLGSQWS